MFTPRFPLVLAIALVGFSASRAQAQLFARFRLQEPLPVPRIEEAPAPDPIGDYVAPDYVVPDYVAPWPDSTQKQLYAKPLVTTNVHCVQHHPHRKACRCCRASVQTVLYVENPRTCCSVPVPVCVPACCQGYADISGRPALLGRGIVWYRWPSGYKIRFVFDARDNVTVHYYGA